MPSASLSRFGSVVHNGIKTKVAGLWLQNSAEVLAGQAKFVFGNCKLLCSLPFSTLADLNILLRPGTVFAGRLDSLVKRKRDLSIVGTLSRTFSIPSVSGPAYQVCGYHIDRGFSNPTCLADSSGKQKFPMAAIASSKAVSGDYIVHKLASGCIASKSNASVLHCKKGSESCISARMSLKNHEQPNHAPIYGYFLYNAARSSYRLYLHSLVESKDFHSSSTSSLTDGTAPDVTFDSTLREDKLENATVSSEKVPSDRALKLLSASCYMPHPDKEETGGEDAHFICAEEQAVGVADGVGGWAELGVDSGQYARELMSNSVTAIREEPKGSIDPARVLEKAHSTTKAKGSSTACIIALTDQGVHAINLGDSGFIVVRDGCTVFRSPVQQHDFNFTYQLESGSGGDLPSCGQVFSIPVAPGDVIIAGTDGLFDNLYSNEVTAVVVHALRAGLGPQVTAQKIAALARQRAQERDRQTPFSTAAQDAGFRYYGGKLDDITVVVSYITSCTKEENSSNSVHSSK